MSLGKGNNKQKQNSYENMKMQKLLVCANTNGTTYDFSVNLPSSLLNLWQKGNSTCFWDING